MKNFFNMTVVVLSMIIGIYVIWWLIMGDPSGFLNGEIRSEPKPGNVLATIHTGGWLVGILIGLILISVTFIFERLLTINKAKGKGNPSIFIKNMIDQLNSYFFSFLEDLGKLTELLKETLSGIFSKRIKGKLVYEQMVKIGIDSLPIALTSALFVGMVFAIQIATEFVRFGASKYVGGVMAIAVARELAPALTGIVIASRVAAAITAEIGTMKVTEQIDALNALGSNPVRYLVIPRFIACTLMMPLLTILSDLVCFWGGYLVAVYVVNINGVDYMNSAQQLLKINDVLGGIFKSFIFGMIISIIACRRGLTTKGGAKGVGEATTSSVVSSLIALFVTNYFLSVLWFK